LDQLSPTGTARAQIGDRGRNCAAASGGL